ncbi:hypothetical protein ACHQM5_002321 [Ranunculus cassubicifolius]
MIVRWNDNKREYKTHRKSYTLILVLNHSDVGKKDSESSSFGAQNKSNLQNDIISSDENMSTCNERRTASVDSGHISCDALGKLNSAKSDLAVITREVFLLKRRLDDVPCQSELIQYERRFSELYAQIQEKHHETRKYYTTYNALLEIKELVLKETSLLNSIITQFKEAISNPSGRVRLIESMEGIAKGTQQKLVKVQHVLQNEQKLLDSLKEKDAEMMAEQRRCSSLLNAFQLSFVSNNKLR